MGIITGRAPPRSSGNKPSPRRAKFKGLASQREYGTNASHGCSTVTVVLIGVTCPAMTVAIVILRALDRARGRALDLLDSA